MCVFQRQMTSVREIVSKVCGNLMDTVELLGEAMMLCQGAGGSRASSSIGLGTSSIRASPDNNPTESAHPRR